MSCLTRGDQIRALNNEELADLLFDISDNGQTAFEPCNSYEYCKKYLQADIDCEQCPGRSIKSWLDEVTPLFDNGDIEQC